MSRQHYASEIVPMNTWIMDIDKLVTLLDLVYTKTQGEIWLYDNDLRVLEHKEYFKTFYKDRIDGFLATKVKCVKIMLRKALYKKFFDKTSDVYKNLCSLRPERLETFYVGCIDDINPKPKATQGHHPWIFYLGNSNLDSRDGIVTLRPYAYPFYMKEDGKGNVAIAWRTWDNELDVLHSRLITGKGKWVESVFFKNVSKLFKSLQAIKQEVSNDSSKVIGYCAGKSKNHKQLDASHSKLTDVGLPPIIAPVDCGIVTTLPEEFKAVVNEFNLDDKISSPYAIGWHRSEKNVLRSVIAIRCDKSGSVHSANTTAKLFQDWRPKSVFLLGRCGGYHKSKNIQEGDVIISSGIFAYEYQSLKKGNVKGKPKDTVEYDIRPVVVASDIIRQAEEFAAEWKYDLNGKYDFKLRRNFSNAHCGVVACGHKLIRSGEEWFEHIIRIAGQRKVIATEMESEGVGAVAESHNPKVPFLMIKGISDFANPKKSDKFKELASDAAAKFLHDLIYHDKILNGRG